VGRVGCLGVVLGRGRKAVVPAQVAPHPQPSPATSTPTDIGSIPTELPVAEPEAVNECLVCHTDKEMLIEMAAPEEVVIRESEGVG
jgi:hypothetical protein